MISGPPGTGKTLLARAIARESGLPFVFASGAEFVESSTGNGSDKIFDIFFTARANVRFYLSCSAGQSNESLLIHFFVLLTENCLRLGKFSNLCLDGLGWCCRHPRLFL